jgi:hypothetical protein
VEPSFQLLAVLTVLSNPRLVLLFAHT